jgi:hypothetical protein
VAIKIHLLIRGRIGDGWVDIDDKLKIPAGTTLRGLLAITDARRIPLRDRSEIVIELGSPIPPHGFYLFPELP